MSASAAETAVTSAPAAARAEQQGGRSNPFLLMPITLFFALLAVAVIRSPNLMSASGIGAAIIVVTPLILATYTLMASTISGRGTVDLSVGPLIGFINVTMIQLHAAGLLESPIPVFLYCMAMGALYQFVFALIVIYVRVQPIIVSLSGYLALSGINLVILPRPGGMSPPFMAEWGYGTSIFSPILIILLIASAAWLLFTATAFYTHLRLMGSDERAAYTSGVPITIVRIGAHLISGCFAGLAAICFTALISSGDPSQGTTYTLIAVTALVLGGASLAGGRGGVFGSALGALNLYLITYVLSTFNFGSVQSFVTNLAYGAILVISLLLTLLVPVIQRYFRNFSPLLYFVVLSVVVLGVILHATFDYAALGAVGAVVPGPLDLQAAMTAPLEIATISPETEALRVAAAPLVLFALLIAVVAVFLRLAVGQSSRRSIAPAVAVIVAMLVLASAYLISQGLVLPDPGVAR
jgi:ribose transport system permease protein